jgi:hypothetical protein
MASHLSGPSSSDDLKIVVYEDDEAASKRLAELETQIQRNGLEIGLALLEIRDLRLYRATHGTFEAYLKERWGYSRSHGYRLISHAIEVQMSPGGDKPKSERETRRKRSEQKKSQERPELVSEPDASAQARELHGQVSKPKDNEPLEVSGDEDQLNGTTPNSIRDKTDAGAVVEPEVPEPEKTSKRGDLPERAELMASIKAFTDQGSELLRTLADQLEPARQLVSELRTQTGRPTRKSIDQLFHLTFGVWAEVESCAAGIERLKMLVTDEADKQEKSPDVLEPDEPT